MPFHCSMLTTGVWYFDPFIIYAFILSCHLIFVLLIWGVFFLIVSHFHSFICLSHLVFVLWLYLWKKGLCFSPHHSVCLSVCLSLCVCVCVCVCLCVSVITFAARWLDLATWRWMRSILSTRTLKCYTSQDDQFPFPFNTDHLYKITFWLVTSKLMNGFTPNFTCM